jgi:energy-coupling factor transport system permease protein
MDLLRSLPLGLYLEQPITWLHHLDPRVKLAWLITFLLTPLLANAEWRVALVVGLICLTLAAMIPWRAWKQQMGWLLIFCLWVFLLLMVAPDGLGSSNQARLPADEIAFAKQSATLPPVPPDRSWFNPFGWGESTPTPIPGAERSKKLPPPTPYRYVLVKSGPFTVTRRSFDVALRFSTLLFTLIYSSNLYLLTTAPEEITAGLEDLLAPLRRFKVPVTEITLTLTLSLRFIPLVLEEFQNLVRSVSTRAINWKKLGLRKTMQVWLLVAERLIENLLLRAEQMASAMQVRGFTSPDRHLVQWHQLRLQHQDWLALGVLGLIWAARLGWGGDS